jgi:hypothetical protein
MKVFTKITQTVLLVLGCAAFNNTIKAQTASICTINSACGYTVEATYTPVSIVPTSNNCPFGYNYNVRFNYTITVVGRNTCWNGNIGIQPRIFCNSGQMNGYYTLTIPSPPAGNASITNRTYTGTLTTSTAPYVSFSDCATATPTSYNCNRLDMSIYAPGIPFTNVPCTPNIILPIDLLSFDVSCTNKQVSIDWATASETNNNYVAVERSQDAQNWKIIHTVNGTGDSEQTKNYSFIDTDPFNGILYYRLKQTDFDGNSTYSNVVAVRCKNKNLSTITIYPNPSDGNVRITGLSQDAVLTLSNSIGDKINEQSISSETTELHFNNLPEGIYFVQIRSGDESTTHKLTIHP